MKYELDIGTTCLFAGRHRKVVMIRDMKIEEILVQNDPLEIENFKLEQYDETKIKEEDPLELNNFTFTCNPIKTEQVLSLESVKSKEKVDISARNEKKCNKCGKIFRYLCSLSAHIKCIHDKVIVKSHKCDFCDLKLKHLASVKRHMKKKHFQLHKCEKCHLTFLTKVDLDHHVEMKHKKKIPTIGEKCYICGKVFEGYHQTEKLKVHMKVNHQDKSLRCDLCGYIFAHKESLERHVFVVHENLKLYKCENCNDAFSHSQDLVSHIERNHQAKTLSCNMCDYTTKVTRNLKRHSNMIHTNDKRYGCDICEKQFKDCYILRQHMSRHYKESLLKCRFCEKGYTRNQALQRHIIDMHQFPMSKRFKCHNCNNVMSSLKYLLEHERQHCAVITSTPP